MHHADLPSPDAGTPPQQLTRQRKAAIIVQLLINDGNRLALSSLPERIQEDLTREIAAIRLVDRDTVNAVAEEFVALLDAIGLSAPGDPLATLEAMSDLISPELLATLREKIESGGQVERWGTVLNLDDATIRQILETEDLQVSAVLLSKLPVARAARLLGALPGERARRIAVAVKTTGDIAPVAVTRIGQALAASYGSLRQPAFGKAPSARMGDILNSSSSKARNTMLGDLEEADRDFATDVRRAIFTFEDIPDRLEQFDVPGCLRDVDPTELARGVAFAIAEGGQLREAADFLLNGLSQRMAQQIRDAGDDMGEIPTSDGEDAVGAIAAVIRDQADAGTIRLKAPKDG
ncbi:flagellar motor switch protein FliG [Salipiger sp. IMCC34102]|uniref:FliG C-terminal domain-containing protein n=1 Tax=Salipiger sp. IMCC34102 TaxID=2510647 RepID=UPI00101CA313|nr:FliG C-terminal domain-containing protein [Salipiger sp. IMCC34102]RYH03302.1 flagellar motor switch protein FliG [Salipiger sp. IMCC34102]